MPPWEKYQAAAAPQADAQEGPWTQYQAVGSAAPTAPAAPQGADPGKAVTGRTQVPEKRRDPYDDRGETAFITGNLNKGVAGIAGLPVDTGLNLYDLFRSGVGVAGHEMRTGRNMPVDTTDFPLPVDRGQYPGSSEWIQNMMRRGNVIPPGTEPQSGGGRYAASVLQALPGAAMGRPSMIQTPRAIGAATTSGLGAEAARDIGGDEYAGAGAMAAGARRMQHKPAGERATEGRRAESFDKARKMGIPVPPRDLKPDKAQQAVQNAGNKELRQPEGTEFSPATLQAYRNAHYADYQAVMKSPALAKGVTPTPAFQAELQAIGNEIESARASLPETFKGMRPVIKLLSEYGYAQMPAGVQRGGITVPPRQQPIPPEVAMRAIKKLRSDASANFSSDRPEKVELGKVQKRLATSIENMIEENLARTGDQGLMQGFKTARTAIAKSHDYEAAMEPGGKINAAKLAAMQNEGAPLSGGTKDIAQVAGAFPGAVQPPKQDDTFTRRVSPMAVTHPPAVAAHQIPRLMDRMWMNPVGQAMINPRGHLTPEQQQMLRYLSAATASNRIPAPPE